MEHDNLATSWISYHQRVVKSGGKADEHDQDFWAYEALSELCRIDPDAAWDALLRITDRTHDEAILACIGAGPLEDLLADHGTDVIGRVLAEIKRSQKFATAVTSVWSNKISPDVWHVLQEAIARRGGV